MRLVFMGTPEFAVPTLTRLIEDGHTIACVFTQPDRPSGRGNKVQPSPVKRLALENELSVYQPQKLKANEEVRLLLETLQPDACIVAAYGKILPQWLLDIPRLGCINVHASLLPKYRGAAPINWAIANGERETGITIMQMDSRMDTGPILARRSLIIGPTEIAPELSVRLANLGAELLVDTLQSVERGKISSVPQDDREATYAPMLKKEDGVIDWQMTAQDISNRVRAFQPWPGSYTHARGQRLILLRADHAEGITIEANSATPSTIVAIGKTDLTVACGGSTFLSVEELQIEGKKRQGARDFVNGLRLKVGDRLAD
jgi:methionyl-tRNA formyltransferase